jgi:predicted RNA binding protein YcfA (HicA-like mRNA interferase family)
MGKLPGVQHLQAIRAFQRAGFEITRQSGHVVMSDGKRTIVIPRNNPINAFTMFGIVRDAGLTVEQFRDLL